MATTYNTSAITSDLILCVDARNPKSYSPNVHPYPLDIGTWVTTGSACTLSRDTTVTDSPVGGIPLKMVVTGTDPNSASYNSATWNLAPAAIGQTWTVSVWVKANGATTAQLFMMEANSSGGYLTSTNSVTSIGTSWTRIICTYTFTQATAAYAQIRLDGPDAGGAVTIWWDGLQVERSSSVTRFNSLRNTNGTNLFDVSGSGNHGTITGATAFNESTGSISFDAAGELITTPITTFGNNTTWEAWVYCRSNASTYNMFMGRYLPYFGFYGGDRFYFSNSIGGVQQTIQTSAVYSLNTWYHAVFTTELNGANIISKIYVNGVLAQTGTFAGTQTGSGTFTIGDGQSINWYRFDGNIANVKVYNRTLNLTEIGINFNAYKGRFGL